MTLFLFFALIASAALLSLAFWMERSAIIGGINGANGLTILVAFIVSASATIPVAAITWWAEGALWAAAVILISSLWHLGAWRFAMSSLQSIVDRTNGDTSSKARP